MSASTSSTRFPDRANRAARLALTVLLPSPGTELVTKITLGGAALRECSSLVRSARRASANGVAGPSTTFKDRLAETALLRSEATFGLGGQASDFPNFGRTAKRGASSNCSTPSNRLYFGVDAIREESSA